jgi:hypothetical protein
MALKKKSVTQLSKEREADELERMALKILTRLDKLQDEIDALEGKRRG